MTAVFNKCVEYLDSGLPSIEEKSAPAETSAMNSPAKVESPESSSPDTTGAEDRVRMYLEKKDSVEKTSIQTPVQRKESAAADEKNQQPVSQTSNQDSRNEKESNPKGTIFKIGNNYCFQVSSWRNKSKAESEVNLFKRKGHNSFLAEGLVRGVTWYRVRIGYFNSIEETEEYMRKLK